MEDTGRNIFYDNNDLGAFCREGGTQFRIWSPGAGEIVLNLYREGNGGEAFEKKRLTSGENGVFCLDCREELSGVYYDYKILRDGVVTRTADPYARACGVNGERSMVIRMEDTDPEGWAEDRAPEKGPETIVYELNVKEYSWAESGGFSREARGTYRAFCEEHTTLHGDGVHPTGLDYLKRLGVTHVQLMPVYDFGSVDEAGSKEQFNWGYDPVNYWIPDGSYSSDPYHGEVRIREFKEMIQSLHRNGFRVIMDVVFNHTYRKDSWLERTVPGYYYRKEADGSWCNGSDCGNDVASERPMCGKYILDCVLYWAGEYHIDGFRFDLMGLLDIDLMNRIQHALDERFGEGEKLIYGEPWSARASNFAPGSYPADKANIRKLDPKIGVFCDCTRDAVKGHVFERTEPGFVNGKDGLEPEILASVTAWCGAEETKQEHVLPSEAEKKDGLEKEAFHPLAPSQVITYISAHDNLTLWDKLADTMECGRYDTKAPGLERAYRLAAAIYMTCQGHLFFLSGEEFGRTKEGIEDSYCSPIGINRLDWVRAYEKEDLVEYYRGLIALRKRLPGLCDKSPEAAKRLVWSRTQPGVVCVRLDNRAGETMEKEENRKIQENRENKPNGSGGCEELLIVYNRNQEETQVDLPDGDWYWLIKGEDSHCWEKEERVKETTVSVEGVSAAVLGRKH